MLNETKINHNDETKKNNNNNKKQHYRNSENSLFYPVTINIVKTGKSADKC